MTGGVFFGGSLVAATVAGMITLFAPCCISVMLPAYFASSFQNRRRLVAMTFLFGPASPPSSCPSPSAPRRCSR
jgi:cytochrome c-type biogenesis protein